MRHIYKKNDDGEYKTADGQGFDCKCVNSGLDTPRGWRKTLADALKVVKKVDKTPAEDNNKQVDALAG